MSIIENELRFGNFTSSKISALISEGKTKGTFGKPAITYIAEKNMERRLKRSLTSESNAKPLQWGKHLEFVVFNKLGEQYYEMSKETMRHNEIDFWSGSPDMMKYGDEKAIVEIKCPITLKSFCEFVDCKDIQEIREKHKDGEDYYWQIVSNSILTGSKYAELVIYVPYKSELDNIRDSAIEYWINKGSDNELTWIHDNGYYKDLNIFRFEIPQSDKDLLTTKVLEAGKYLISR